MLKQNFFIDDKYKVSYLIPCYNHEEYIIECLESILKQTYKNIEIIVCDDASSDQSLEILKKYEKLQKIKLLINKENKGLIYTANKLLNNATGDYICYLASDDYIFPLKTEKQLVKIVEKGGDILVGNVKFSGKSYYFYRLKMLMLTPLLKNQSYIQKRILTNFSPFMIQSGMFKANILKKYGFLAEYKNDDWLLLVRMILDEKKIYYYGKTLAYYRLHENNFHKNYKQLSKKYIKPVIANFIPIKYRSILEAKDDYNSCIYYLNKDQVIKAKYFFYKAYSKKIIFYSIFSCFLKFFIYKLKNKGANL